MTDMDNINDEAVIHSLYNSYIFYKTSQGGTVGRPVNPFHVSHKLYFDFEAFASERTYYVTAYIKPGYYHRGHIEEIELQFSDDEDWGFENSEVPVHKEYVWENIFQMKLYNLIDKSKWGGRQTFFIKNPN